MRTKLLSDTAALAVQPANPAAVKKHEDERAFVAGLHAAREPRELRDWRAAREAIRAPIDPTAGHYKRTPIPGGDERLPERRFTVGRFVPAHEEGSR